MQCLSPTGLPHLSSSLLPLPISSTYEFSLIQTKIRLLSKGQSDRLKEKYALLDLCPLGYKYAERALGEILCLHRQTPGSTFPPPSSSHPLRYSRTTVREKQASPYYVHGRHLLCHWRLKAHRPSEKQTNALKFQPSARLMAEYIRCKANHEVTRGQRGALPLRTRGSLPSRLSDSSTMWSGWEGITLLGSLVFSS